MVMQRAIKRILWRTGWDIVQFNPATHPLARRARLLRKYKIDLVLDIGANTGQFGRELRELRYAGRIVSFEPLESALAELLQTAAGDVNWQVRNHACGAQDGKRTIRVAANSQSSSFLPMRPRHLQVFPDSRYVGTELVEVKRLDTIFDEVAEPGERIWLKIDAQGFEAEVLAGAAAILHRIDAIQAEVSLEALYEGETTVVDFLPMMARKGFVLVAVEGYLSDPETSELLQIECIFKGTRCQPKE
jgi:FkbM family methyltransferase